MSDDKRDFKGVWIPKEIWLNPDLTIMEKLFLVEIDSLDNDDGCYASNKHFSEFFKITKGRCTQIIKGLEAKGLITSTIKRDGKQITSRTLRVVNKLNRVVNKLNYPSEEIKHPYLENAQESNTVSNNTKEGKKAKPVRRKFGEYQRVLLTEEQYHKLALDYGKEKADQTIKAMDEWIELKGKSPYDNYNLAIRRWIARDQATQKPIEPVKFINGCYEQEEA